jgi:putative peptidoglycan lipid II flippase
MAANVGLALTLFVIPGAVGIVVATTLAGWLQVALLAGTLRTREEFALDATFRRRFPGICGASLIMGAVVWAMAHGLEHWFDPANGLLVQVAALAGLVATGLAVYGATVWVLGVVRPQALLARLTGR